ncbi:cytochrome b/b6 domain-containing protein [Pseudomonas sp.]|jgi:cytochrome b561|uniref:cytochrome b n=1 Tax=Pseudomonas sp. TaxID=306 RepID=UPI00261DE2E9|nr:cytochrome b/b6 domain-containing protein [Pseudomonas sp.]
MRSQKYSKLMVLLHWVSALVICWALISGFYTGLFPVKPEVKQWVAFLNISITTLFIPVFILRLYVRQTHPKPDPTAGRPTEQLAAALVHALLYGAVGLVLVTGTLMMDRHINVFDLFSIPNLINDPYWLAVLFNVHEAGCAILGILVVTHIAAVVKHEWAGKRVVGRMLF